MKKLICIFSFSASVNMAVAQNIDSMVANLNNESLQNIYFTPLQVVRDSLGQTIDRKTSIGVFDERVLEIVRLGYDAVPYLYEHFKDEDKDYTINLILYCIYGRDASPMMSYASKSSIGDWKKYRKEVDYNYWKNLIEGR